MHATIILFKGTVSFQFAAVRLLYIGIGNSVAYYQLHLFTIKLFAQLYDKGHNGFTHSQCTSLQSKVGETIQEKKETDLFFCTFQTQSRALWLKRHILKSVH